MHCGEQWQSLVSGLRESFRFAISDALSESYSKSTLVKTRTSAKTHMFQATHNIHGFTTAHKALPEVIMQTGDYAIQGTLRKDGKVVYVFRVYGSVTRIRLDELDINRPSDTINSTLAAQSSLKIALKSCWFRCFKVIKVMFGLESGITRFICSGRLISS